MITTKNIIGNWPLYHDDCVQDWAEVVVARWSNPLTLQLEQAGGHGSIPCSVPPLERHDKGS